MKRNLQRLPPAPDPPQRVRILPSAEPPVADVAEIRIDLERAAAFIEEIRDLRLTDDVQEAVTGYEDVGERNSFLWRWVRRGVEITSLSSIQSNLRNHVCDTKTLGVMFDVLIDDVADESNDRDFLEALVGIVDGRVELPDGVEEPHKRHYFAFTRHVWDRIWRRVSSYPRFEEFRDVLLYDYRQLMNAMRYSMLINDHPSMMNLIEHDSYLPHNMHMVISGTIDVMCSPTFDVRELGRLRTALSHAQTMGRIGNLVTTWEREIRERDYSSGVFAMALSLGAIDVADLERGDQETISRKIREGAIEKRFLLRWKKMRARLLRLQKEIASVDIGLLVTGLETLIQLHLGSRGLK